MIRLARSDAPRYAELAATTNFSFLRGASHPEELVARASELGYAALAITDECSLAGVVRAHVAAKQHRIKLLVGAEFRIEDGPQIVLLATGAVLLVRFVQWLLARYVTALSGVAVWPFRRTAAAEQGAAQRRKQDELREVYGRTLVDLADTQRWMFLGGSISTEISAASARQYSSGSRSPPGSGLPQRFLRPFA